MEENKTEPKSILFVCTGNTCRSVMAKGLLNKALLEKNKNIKISSAGTLTLNGVPPTKETIEVMKRAGIDVSNEKSREITKEIVNNANLILTMTNSHKSYVIEKFPEAKEKVFLLSEYVSSNSGSIDEIPDPIGQSLDFYQETLNAIKGYIEKLSNLI